MADLQGKVVLIDVWTYTCINWLRTLPYVRAWAEKYRSHGLVVIGVQPKPIVDRQFAIEFLNAGVEAFAFHVRVIPPGYRTTCLSTDLTAAESGRVRFLSEQVCAALSPS